jgi:glycosyltransferase involved in cell wall biosynthesis
MGNALKILTISIAAYNMEKYIKGCLDSFISDQLYETLEVLVINDGSTDNTSQIAQQYVDKYPQIFKLINKKNGGHGSTINAAIKLATGKYFKPVDGDDWIDTENLIKMIDKLKEIDVDLVLTDFYHYYSNSGEKKLASLDLWKYEIKSDFNAHLPGGSLVFHSMTYKTLLLKENSILFSEKISYEDTEFVLFPLPYANTFYYMPVAVYYYRLERDGQSVSVDGIIKHKNDLQQVIKNIFIFYEKKKKGGINKIKCYKARILLALEFYYRATCTDMWLNTERKNRKENSIFYRDLLFISPSLFIPFILKRKIRILQFITFFQLDYHIMCIRKYLKGKNQ